MESRSSNCALKLTELVATGAITWRDWADRPRYIHSATKHIHYISIRKCSARGYLEHWFVG